MAEVASSTHSRAAGSLSTHRSPPVAVAIPTNPAGNGKNQYLGLDAFSPVNQNGSFDFDRVLKCGDIHKRSRKTKSWKRFYLVLRPHVLALYKSRSEEKLLKQLSLADVTAVAILKDPKGRRSHMFGVFSPSRNYHFQANNDQEAREWVDLIKREARVDEEEHFLSGSAPTTAPHPSMDTYILSGDETGGQYDRQMSSSPEPIDVSNSYTTTKDGIKVPAYGKSAPSQNLDYSGVEQSSFSDFSDTAPSRIRKSALVSVDAQQANQGAVAANSGAEAAPRMSMGRNVSGTSLTSPGGAASGTGAAGPEPERVIYHGWLLCLKSKGGVRQWKRLWTVLRGRSLAFYKNEDEYAAQLLIPLSAMLSAVEIDPVSKTKSHCMQIIAEDKSYRFAAPTEEALAKWLGAIKSQLAKKKEKATPAAATAAVKPEA